MGKAPIDFIHFTRENLPKLSLGERAEFMSTVDLKTCSMKVNSQTIFVEECLTLRTQEAPY